MALVRPAASRLAGPIGRLAAGTVARAVSRTGVAVAALMVAVSVTIGVSVMIASFRSTVANWLGLTLVADVYVSAPRSGGARSPAPALRRRPGAAWPPCRASRRSRPSGWFTSEARWARSSSR